MKKYNFSDGDLFFLFDAMGVFRVTTLQRRIKIIIALGYNEKTAVRYYKRSIKFKKQFEQLTERLQSGKQISL